MKPVALLLILCLTAPAFADSAGSPLAPGAVLDPLYNTCPAVPPNDTSTKLADGALYMTIGRAKHVACLLETCDTKRKSLQLISDGREPPPTWLWWGIGITLASLVGFVAGAVLHPFGALTSPAK